MSQGEALDSKLADIVANAMKDWAIEKGATHYCHWFQPLSGFTAEKHESFISPTREGEVIQEFSGKALIHGESDASAFPSGGLRAIFEARGYTAWDPTSYAFVRNGTLVIPTAFCSHGGEALDKKTPLLRSMEAINRQALRIVRCFGYNDKRIVSTSGLEQEYFLIDKELYMKRRDLRLVGRTLFGAELPLGQTQHYSASIKPRVLAFMRAVDDELWRLGVSAKTRHNEAAPAQHELAPIFTTTNIATDHNQLIMAVMRDVANEHGLVCLFHEKPFRNVNGSGKHNNWSLITDTGVNLFNPGSTPQKNVQFLTFLCAVIKAVDEYADLLRLSASSAGNDLRLGDDEAPPATMSVFLGDELTSILECVESGSAFVSMDRLDLETGLDAIPGFPKEINDRNRTSPMAFTGDKLEFRMLGASFSGSESSMVMNTIVAQALKEFADVLEKDKNALDKLLKDTVRKHKRIIFNGNSYSDNWDALAGELGLLKLESTVDAIPCYTDEKTLNLFCGHNVMSAPEIEARREIVTSNYINTIKTEALVMLEMAHREIMPAAARYASELAQAIATKREAGVFSHAYESSTLGKISVHVDKCHELCVHLEQELANNQQMNSYAAARYCRECIIPIMSDLREQGDALECVVPDWPMPTYGDLLFEDL
jgi:glutamine synthetase